MPAVESESLADIVQTVAAHDLRQTGVRGREFRILAVDVKVVRTAEVVFRTGAADGREFGVAVHEELDFTFAPPAVVVYTPEQVRADVLTLALDAVDDGVVRLVRQRVDAVEAGAEVRDFVFQLGFDVVDLVVDRRVAVVDVFERDACALLERHRPVAVQTDLRVDTNRERVDLGVNFRVRRAEEVAERAFHSRNVAVIPVHTENQPTPAVRRAGDPEMLDRTFRLNVAEGECGVCRNRHRGGNLPAAAEVTRAGCTGTGFRHAGLAFFAGEVFRAYRAGLCKRQLGNVVQVCTKSVEHCCSSILYLICIVIVVRFVLFRIIRCQFFFV